MIDEIKRNRRKFEEKKMNVTRKSKYFKTFNIFNSYVILILSLFLILFKTNIANTQLWN